MPSWAPKGGTLERVNPPPPVKKKYEKNENDKWLKCITYLHVRISSETFFMTRFKMLHFPTFAKKGGRNPKLKIIFGVGGFGVPHA